MAHLGFARSMCGKVETIGFILNEGLASPSKASVEVVRYLTLLLTDEEICKDCKGPVIS